MQVQHIRVLCHTVQPRGLCGNMDGGQGNDFTSASGIQTTVAEFAESYRQPGCTTPAPDPNGNFNPCDLQQNVSYSLHCVIS